MLTSVVDTMVVVVMIVVGSLSSDVFHLIHTTAFRATFLFLL